ncbi:MAG: FAD-binding oxidoreductase [Anaerolineae bacterium]|nr:FAD-binding oxidoreductase [Anaerolineae bacterium]
MLVPGDTGYDAARRAWNLTVDQHPALIVVAGNTSDIVEAVRFARQNGLSVAIMSTGHGIVLPADNSLLIVTSRMTGVHVDAESQTAWVEAGVKWGMVLEKAQTFGLAPLLGSSPSVGVVGYTLGGGMGWLARKYGMAIDSVLYFELVTPDGCLVRASETENSDLFWALRGGGGNFGIVTGMAIKLYPVTTIYGGTLVYPAEQAKEVLVHYREWIANAPDELTSSITLMNFPPIPAVPEFLRGRSGILVRAAYAGAVADGEALINNTWVNWKAPIANMFRAMPFADVAEISNDPKDPMPSVGTGAWMREMSDEAIDTLIQYGIGTPITMIEIRHAGGAITRINRQANPYSNRDAVLLMHAAAAAPTRELHERLNVYMTQLMNALQPALTGGVFLNFLNGKEARARTKDAYTAENYQRLQAIKARYDPENRFRHSFDISPVAPDNRR